MRQVKEACRRLSRELHPDGGSSPDVERFKKVTNAKDVLRDVLKDVSEDLTLRTPDAEDLANSTASTPSQPAKAPIRSPIIQQEASRRSIDSRPAIARRSPNSGLSDELPIRPPKRSSRPYSYTPPANRTKFSSLPWGTLIVIVTVSMLAFVGWRIYLDLDSFMKASREREAKHQQELQAIPRVCNEIFNDDDFSVHVDPVLNQLGYKYSERYSFPTTRSCDWSFKIEGSWLRSVIYVSVQCGALANSTWAELVDSGQAAPFDPVPGAYINTATSSDADDGSAGDRAILRTSSGDLVMAYVHLFTTMSPDDYPPLAHRKDVLAAALPVAAKRESAKRIC